MISLRLLWRNLFRRPEFERNLSEELASYADLLTEEKSAAERALQLHAARRFWRSVEWSK